MASRILDMGDVLTLIEQAEKAFDAEQAERMAAKVARARTSPSTTSSSRCRPSRRWARSARLLGMLPGMGEMKAQLDQVDDRELDRVAAIIQSMTPAERQDPKILNGSRRARIARVSGVEVVSDVNGLVERFADAQKMMKQMRTGGGMPGMPGMPGHGWRKRAKASRSRRRSPARGQAQREPAAKRADGPPPPRSARAGGTRSGLPRPERLRPRR